MVQFREKERQKREKPGPPVHDDLCAYEDIHGVIRHRFTATGPNELLLTDISEHWTLGGGKLYLCAVEEAFSGRIVGYSIGSRMKASLAVNALKHAVRMRGNVKGCKVHSDRGAQFRSRKFRAALKRYGLVGSMGRVGAAGYDAAMESFFALLQKNVLDQQVWDSSEQLRTAIVWWIQRTYHRRRKQTRLGKLTPVDFESKLNQHVAKVA